MSKNLYHIITFQYNSMILLANEKSTILAYIYMFPSVKNCVCSALDTSLSNVMGA